MSALLPVLQVIHGCLDQARASKMWCFDRKQAIWQQSGSGNNWAHGYFRHGPVSSAGILEKIEKVRRWKYSRVLADIIQDVIAFIENVVRKCMIHLILKGF